MWGIGAAATPLAMFFVVLATLVLAALLVHTGGFRASIERTLLGVLREAIEAMAVVSPPLSVSSSCCVR